MATVGALPGDVLESLGAAAEWLYDGRAWVDLAVAGLGFDLVGAWLLALAFLISPHEAFSRTHAQETVFTPMDEERQLAHDTLRAFFGVALLGLGFTCQLVALVAAQASESPPASGHRAIVALICAVVAVAVGAAAAWLGVRLAFGPFLAQAESIRRRLYKARMASLPRIGQNPQASPTPPAKPGQVPSTVPKKVVAESVEALLDNAKALADGEEARGASLKQRAGWLLGFLGVMLTILLTQARALPNAQLGAVGTPVAGAFVVIALACILRSAYSAIQTLSVVKLWHFEPAETAKYPTYEYISQAPEDVRGKMLRGWVRQFSEERPANTVKATQLQTAFRWLMHGFLALAGLALTVLARAFGI